MNSNFTEKDVNVARKLERDRKRATLNAWTNGGVPISDEHQASLSKNCNTAPDKFAELYRQKLRADYLGWIFNGVEIDDFQEDWNKLSPAQKERLKAKMPGGQQLSNEQLQRFFRAANLQGNLKECFVVTAQVKAARVLVIEHSGLTNNWISNEQVKQVGLKSNRCSKVTDKMLTGMELSSEEYVDVPWVGKHSFRGITRFFVLPGHAPIQMLVGRQFIEKYPGTLMDQNPQPQQLPLQ